MKRINIILFHLLGACVCAFAHECRYGERATSLLTLPATHTINYKLFRVTQSRPISDGVSLTAARVESRAGERTDDDEEGASNHYCYCWPDNTK